MTAGPTDPIASASAVPSGAAAPTKSRSLPRIRVEDGETDHVTYRGDRIRRPTVLIKVGELAISKRAFLLGTFLAVCQILDGFLTYLGVSLRGVQMEGNTFLRVLMYAYGATAVLFFAKLFALLAVILLTVYAHRRRWIRPLIATLIAIYLALAIIPWVYIISSYYAFR